HYRIGLGYSDAQGIILKSGLKKYTANINGQYKFLESRKLSVDFNLLEGENDEQSSAIQSNSGFQGNIIGEALQWNPTQPLFNPDGTVYIKHGDAVVN